MIECACTRASRPATHRLRDCAAPGPSCSTSARFLSGSIITTPTDAQTEADAAATAAGAVDSATQPADDKHLDGTAVATVFYFAPSLLYPLHFNLQLSPESAIVAVYPVSLKYNHDLIPTFIFAGAVPSEFKRYIKILRITSRQAGSE